MPFKKYFLVGGAGFIGSHFVDALLQMEETALVTIYDNFSSGQKWHYQHHLGNPKLIVIEGDAQDSKQLKAAMQGHNTVMHFASNPDIARAIKNPSIDFEDGFYLTYQIIEAARMTGVERILYMSGSGVYGEAGNIASKENDGNLYPISTYGASKLAGEAFISSYCHMFNLSACIFRFANVVGPRQTHGVGFDFINKLITNSNELTILGDGNQSKSYIHIDDVVQSVLLANQKLKSGFEVYNVATEDYISVNEIARIIVDCMGLKNVIFKHTGGDRGWKGDVPIVRLCTKKIRELGWKCERNSFAAIKDAALAMLYHLHNNEAKKIA